MTRLTLFLLAASAAFAQNFDRMDQVIHSYVDKQEFMGTVAVTRGTNILLSKGYGKANLEWDIPNEPTTKFRLGSVTKQFTAACILLLEERGKLRTGDLIKTYMPDAPAAWDKVTIFHLLTHTSGIPSFTSFPDYPKLEPFKTTTAELVARFRDKPLEFEPGSKWSYNNSGYVLLGYLIEKTSGMSYAQFVQDNIFTPLEMKDSGYDSNSAVIPHRASGYVHTEKGFENAGFIHMSIPHAAGALYSTTLDLLKWAKGVATGKLLSEASVEKMTTPYKNNYAMGLMISNQNGRRMIGHGGGIEGFNTQISYYPESQVAVVVLGNVNGAAPGAIANQLGALAHGESVKLTSERKEVSLDEKLLASYVGTYELPMGKLLVKLEGGQLSAKLGGQVSLPLFAESETSFFAKTIEAQVDFRRDRDGKVTGLVLHLGGSDMEAKRISETAEKP